MINNIYIYIYVYLSNIYIYELNKYNIYIWLININIINININIYIYTCCTLTMFDKIAKSFRWNCAIWIHLGELLGNHQLSSSHLERTWWHRCHKPGMAMAAMAHAVYCKICKWDRLAPQDGPLGHQPSTSFPTCSSLGAYPKYEPETTRKIRHFLVAW